jgi:hypothetical protein
MFRTCAVCGKRICYRDICSECFKKYGNKGEYPNWLSELIKIQSRFERQYASHEIPFTRFDETEHLENIGYRYGRLV